MNDRVERVNNCQRGHLISLHLSQKSQATSKAQDSNSNPEKTSSEEKISWFR